MQCGQKVSNHNTVTTSSNTDFSTIGYCHDTVVCASVCL